MEIEHIPAVPTADGFRRADTDRLIDAERVQDCDQCGGDGRVYTAPYSMGGTARCERCEGSGYLCIPCPFETVAERVSREAGHELAKAAVNRRWSVLGVLLSCTGRRLRTRAFGAFLGADGSIDGERASLLADYAREWLDDEEANVRADFAHGDCSAETCPRVRSLAAACVADGGANG